MTQKALEVRNNLIFKKIYCGVLHLHTIKPIDYEKIIKYSHKVKLIVTIEEHFRSGGLGSSVLEILNEHFNSNSPRVIRVGIENKFLNEYGSQDTLQDSSGLNVNNIGKKILNYFKK